jgi:hypothetical protein
VVDITASRSIDFAKANELDIPNDCPHVAEWHEEISNRPSAVVSK